MDKFFNYLLNNKSNSNVSNDIYIPSEELNNMYSSSMPSTNQYIPSQELNNMYSSSVPQLNYTSYSSAMPSTDEYILSQELNNIYLSAVSSAPQQLIMESNYTTVFNPSGYTGMYGINQTYGYTSGSTGTSQSYGYTGTNQSNLYATGLTGASQSYGYTGTNQSNLYAYGLTGTSQSYGYTGTNQSNVYMNELTGTSQSYGYTYGPSGAPYIGQVGYSGMSGTNQSCSHTLYNKIKLVIKNELIFFEVLPNDNSRVYIFNYKGITKKVILKINPKNGESYANLKFMELVQILDDIRLNDENSDIKKAINNIIMNDPFISSKIYNKIKITI
jgi:hypothetical protein